MLSGVSYVYSARLLLLGEYGGWGGLRREPHSQALQVTTACCYTMLAVCERMMYASQASCTRYVCVAGIWY